ncbi:septation protein SepH [Nocardioides sp. Kera G14]|uniref:septation protein SepH n=1 Tax=Nocardioides sp. Kera G14 TaxID=2884264 RepID=UPI001D0FCA8C|nr:septation protein SepH [Nocardioides sp. Kera G14]UDY22373.1 DUF3071 domain-containing protein [Nocardioides sp. Kera G14]
MSAEELSLEARGELHRSPAHQEWTVASVSRDGTRMLLVDADGNEMSVAVAPDALPRRSEKTTVNTGNQGSPTLRPRDIQARIRAGESPESVAEAAGTTLERIMPFAAPVMAEREHMAGRAQKATVRRQASESTARTLGDAVAKQVAETDSIGTVSAEDVVEWDAWRRPDGRWALVALYTTSARSGAGEFTFDAPGNFVSLDNDDARWLVGDLPPEEVAPPAPEGLRLVEAPAPPTTPPPTAAASAEPIAPVVTPVQADEPVVEAPAVDADPQLDESPIEPTAVIPPTTPPPSWTPPAPQPIVPGSSQSPAPPPAKKSKRRRASIPSWDEIMFGGAEPSKTDGGAERSTTDDRPSDDSSDG